MRLKPKKSLGQNFLTDKNIQAKIVDAAGFTGNDSVLEIGAGRGELTVLLSPLVKHLTALELDPRLCGQLNLFSEKHSNLKIINCDVLKFDFKKFLKSLKAKKIKVMGNIPYYISTPIIEKLLEHREKIDSAYLTVQKEFAERIAAAPGSKTFGSLSCFVQYYAQPKIIFTISRNSFYPAPKVDSCLLLLKMRLEPAFKVRDEKQLFTIIRAAFNQRRKTLRNSLKEIVPAEKLNRFFDEYRINPDIRPESLALENFAKLANL